MPSINDYHPGVLAPQVLLLLLPGDTWGISRAPHLIWNKKQTQKNWFFFFFKKKVLKTRSEQERWNRLAEIIDLTKKYFAKRIYYVIWNECKWTYLELKWCLWRGYLTALGWTVGVGLTEKVVNHWSML